MSTVPWRQSSYSDTQGNECVEVACLSHGIGVRDSKNPTGPHLTLSARSFATLIKEVKAP